MSNFLLKAVACLSTAAALGSGGYAWHMKREARRHGDEQQSSVEQCKKDLGTCTDERTSKEKTAAEAAASLNASRVELDELRTARAEDEKRLAAFKALTDKFQKMIDSGKLQIILRHGRMVVKLPAGVLFASGSADLSKEGKDALHEVAAILRQVHDRRFMVAGHTDNVPVDPKAMPPSPFKNNLDLSTARALTVAQQLIASGMNRARLVAAGYSEHEPVRENTTEAGRQENRRIEIVLLPNVTELPVVPATTSPSAAPPDAGASADAAAAAAGAAGAAGAAADAGATGGKPR